MSHTNDIVSDGTGHRKDESSQDLELQDVPDNDDTTGMMPQQSPATTTLASSERLQTASESAVELVQKFANIDPHDDSVPNNPWKDPQTIMDQLCQARGRLTDAWKIYEKEYKTLRDEQQQQEKGTKDEVVPDEEFRVLYMDMITDAFGDVLEEMRLQAGEDNIDINVLVDCLQSGVDFLEEDQRNHLSYFDSMEFPDEAEHDVPIHELRQASLGIPTIPTTDV